MGDLWSCYIDFDMRRMDNWERIVPAFKYNKELPFFETLVPTTDTVRFGYLLEKLLKVNRPVLYTGNTGVGKVSKILQFVVDTIYAKNKENFVLHLSDGSVRYKKKKQFSVCIPFQSVVARGLLQGIADKVGYVPVFVNFSAQTSSMRTQEMIESKLEKKRKTVLGAPEGKRVIIFVDDLNMPKLDTYGSQPPIELLRQFQDFGGMYDRDKLHWKEFQVS